MSETLTHSHEAANLTHEQMAQDVIGRSQKLIARAEHGVGVRPTYGGGKRYVVGTGEKTERSAWSGEEHKSLTSYSVALEAGGSVEIRRDIETHTPEKHSRGRSSGHAFEVLTLKGDGSAEYIDASEENGKYSRYEKRTDANMNADQMEHFANGVFYALGEELET